MFDYINNNDYFCNAFDNHSLLWIVFTTSVCCEISTSFINVL